MIVKGFEATNVFGYLNFDIQFNKDKNFLVGGNGSGKTTALKLINALITPNFRELLTIPFKECSLSLEVDGENIYIFAFEKDNSIHLTISNCDDEVILPSTSEVELFSRREDRLEELIEDLTREYALNPVIEAISSISSPVFLGLDRRTESLDSNRDYFLEREMFLNGRKKNLTRVRRLIKGSIGASLMEIEILVKNNYKRVRDLEIEQSHTLRNQILISSFKYSKFDEKSFALKHAGRTEQRKLIARKNEIKKALSNIIGFDSSINEEVDTFFNDLNDLFDGLSSVKRDDIGIELLLNTAQIDRMHSIVDIIDEHKSRNDEYYKPINDFLKTVNEFYKDSGKSLEIDTVGQLVVQRPDGNECTIEGLSSGERQLLVIFAHSYFNQSNIFIIDEPELSLHLGWQEKLADTIFLANTGSQFILATHSPEIIAGNKNKAVGCR